MGELCVTLPGLPPTVNHQYARHWQGGQGLTGAAAAWQAGATLAVRAAAGGPWPARTPLAVALELVAPDVYRWDLDNRIKGAIDATAAGLGIDDRYICALYVRKARGAPATTTIRVQLRPGGATGSLFDDEYSSPDQAPGPLLAGPVRAPRAADHISR